MASNVIIILSIVVALLAVASAVLGFIAQATKLTPNEIQFDESTGVCVYPAKPAYALGICALPLLVAAMVISTVAAAGRGCFGCVKPHGGGASWYRRVKGVVVCCVASWILAAVAADDYVKGVKWNAATTRGAIAIGLYDYGCHYLKGNAFGTAAVMTLVAAALGIGSFTIMLTPAPAAPADAAGAEPKHDGQQSASAPPHAQGQAHAQV